MSSVTDKIKGLVLEEQENSNKLSTERDKLLKEYKELGGKTPTCGICDEACVPTFQLGCCGVFIHTKCTSVELCIQDWIKNSLECPFCHEKLSSEDLEKIREYRVRVPLIDKLGNKNIREIFEIYHDMICENKELESEIEFLSSFIGACDLVKKNTCSDCAINWITGSNNNPMCDHVSPKVGGRNLKEEPEATLPSPNFPGFIGKIKILSEFISNSHKGQKICPTDLIEFVYCYLTNNIESLGKFTAGNEVNESILLLIITVCINWEKERENIDSICAKGNISASDIQRMFDKEFESLFDDEDEDYATILATIKIGIAIQLMKPVDERMYEEYLEKKSQLVSDMRYYLLVSTILLLLDEEL
jgi:hypothetical protein